MRGEGVGAVGIEVTRALRYQVRGVSSGQRGPPTPAGKVRRICMGGSGQEGFELGGGWWREKEEGGGAGIGCGMGGKSGRLTLESRVGPGRGLWR